MPSFDQKTCIHKFAGCRIDLDEQPAKLPNMLFGVALTTFTEFYCPECITGYFWDMEHEPWSCRPCNQSTYLENAHHCLQCPSSMRCTDCDMNYFPKYDQKGCMLPIANCKTNPSQYQNNGTHYFCPDCMIGHFRNETKCSACPAALTNSNGCLTCSDNTTCAVCQSGYMRHPDGQDPDLLFDLDWPRLQDSDGLLTACFEQFEFCQLLPSMYNVTEEGN